MSYRYQDHTAWLASPEGVKAVGEVLRNVEKRMIPAGCATMHRLWPSTGDSDTMQAAVDHVCMLGFIEEVPLASVPWGQHRVFRKPEPE